MGINLKGDSMSAQEQQLYDQRQKIVNEQTVKDLILVSVQGAAGKVASGVAGRAGQTEEAKPGAPVPTAVGSAVSDKKVLPAPSSPPQKAPGVDYATVNGKPVQPFNYETLYHGTDAKTVGAPGMTADQLAQKIYAEGLPARGSNVDLVDHTINQSPDRAFRGATQSPVTQEKNAGAAYWADEGGIVIKLKNVPGYDVNQALEGQVKTPTGFSGNPKYGEQEIAVPGAIKPENIDKIFKVEVGSRGALRLIEIEKK
jgi:hypothetical protein